MKTPQLPPESLVPLPDPVFDNAVGPYAISALRVINSTRANPEAANWYRKPQELTHPQAVLSCYHPMLAIWIEETKGLAPRAEGVRQPPAESWPLPGVIPQVSPSSKGLPFPLPVGTYAIDYSVITHKPGQAPKSWATDLRSFFPEGSQLILTFFSERALTLGLWGQDDFWDAPALKSFDAIVSPDFYSFCNTPYAQVLLGERQQQIFLGEGVAKGHNVIPQIAWANEMSFRRQIDTWANAGINTILLNCYANSVHPTLWKQRWLQAMRKHLQGHENIRFVIAGMTPGWAIGQLNEIFPDGNYTLLPSALQFVAAQRKVVKKEDMTRRFMASMQALADFRSGKTLAPPRPLPEETISWQACRVS